MTPHTRSALLLSSTILLATFASGSALAEETSPATASAAAVAAKPAVFRSAKQMDLRPPNITHLFTSEQLNAILAASFRSEELEGVEVEGDRDRIVPNTPTPWGGIAAPFWAVLNPTEAWRIFMPLAPDQTRGLRNASFNATDEYVLEPAGTPSPHAH